MLARALLRRRDLGLLDESVLHLRVLPTDLDPNWHVNNGRYLTLMDLGRIDLTVRMGFLRLVFGRRWMPVLGGAVIRFQRPLALWARYDLRTRLVGWDEKWLYLEQRFESGGRTVAVACVRGLLRGPEGSVPTPDLLRAIGMERPSPPLPEAVRQWQALDSHLT
ncbi:MAG TPA: thioesterase family protein [Gemmatimonadales bacterium]|nr:thioesterase family protein [Gemmatimonadales bacterium]